VCVTTRDANTESPSTSCSLSLPRKPLAMDCDTINTTSTRLALGDRTNFTSARVFDDWRPTCQALRRKRTHEDSEDDYGLPSSSPTKSGRAEVDRENSHIEAIAPVQASRRRARNACTLRLIRDSLSALRPRASLPGLCSCFVTVVHALTFAPLW
jgi:hypothetical protein